MLHGVVQAGVAPLVGAAVAELVREVVVVEVDPVGVAVVVLEVLLAVHEDLHGLAPALHPGDDEDAADGAADHVELHARREEVVEEALRKLREGHRLEAVLRVEVLRGVDRGVVDAADDPRRPVEGADDRVLEAHDRVGAAHPAVRAHLLLALHGEVRADGLDRPRRERMAAAARGHRRQSTGARAAQEAGHCCQGDCCGSLRADEASGPGPS
mmetsp:Transcript_19272/g.52455  ORF Transcript_19272/g.52455 Transcript_19272/m.52455 type:complete len:213 (+) Transcript_19272:105-743(+)